MTFSNEPVLELRRAPVRESLLEALGELESRLPLSVPVLVGGERREGAGFVSTDPGATSRVVAEAMSADEEDARVGVEAAQAGYREWSARPAAERAEVLRRAADLMAARRFELAATMVYECAKPWREADGDVCESIDYLRYYAGAGRKLTSPPGTIPPRARRNESLPL